MMCANDDPNVQALVTAARGAALRLDTDLWLLKRSHRVSDGRGGLRPFNRRALSADDRMWIESDERRLSKLQDALVPFGAALPSPAGL